MKHGASLILQNAPFYLLFSLVSLKAEMHRFINNLFKIPCITQLNHTVINLSVKTIALYETHSNSEAPYIPSPFKVLDLKAPQQFPSL